MDTLKLIKAIIADLEDLSSGGKSTKALLAELETAAAEEVKTDKK